MTSLRLPTSFALSVLATAAMFWFLGLLIAADDAIHDRIETVGPILFTNHIPEPVEITIPHRKPPIEKPKPPPDAPTISIPTDPSEIVDQKGLDPALLTGGDGPLVPTQYSEIDRLPRTGAANRAPIPQVRIEPDYPAAARARDIEGYVTFRFTVAVDGSVKDVEILDSDPPQIWDTATIRAVSNWKYQPAVRDGKPVEQRGMVATYRYEMER